MAFSCRMPRGRDEAIYRSSARDARLADLEVAGACFHAWVGNRRTYSTSIERRDANWTGVLISRTAQIGIQRVDQSRLVCFREQSSREVLLAYLCSTEATHSGIGRVESDY